MYVCSYFCPESVYCMCVLYVCSGCVHCICTVCVFCMCALYVCTVHVYCMHVLYVCSACVLYVCSVLHVCNVYVFYMCVLYVCSVCECNEQDSPPLTTKITACTTHDYNMSCMCAHYTRHPTWLTGGTSPCSLPRRSVHQWHSRTGMAGHLRASIHGLHKTNDTPKCTFTSHIGTLKYCT